MLQVPNTAGSILRWLGDLLLADEPAAPLCAALIMTQKLSQRSVYLHKLNLHRAHVESHSLPFTSHPGQDPAPFAAPGTVLLSPQLLSPGLTAPALCQWAVPVHFQPNTCRYLEPRSKTMTVTPAGHPGCSFQCSEGLGFGSEWICLRKRVRYSPSMLPNVDTPS